MPVDLTLCRNAKEGGVIDEVKSWQLKRSSTCKSIDRCTDQDEETKQFLSRIQELDRQKRHYLRDYNEQRSRLNRLQNSLAPKKKKNQKKQQQQHDREEIDDSTCSDVVDLQRARNEIKVLKSDTLPSLSGRLDRTSSLLQQELARVSNIVDDAEFIAKKLDHFNATRGGVTLATATTTTDVKDNSSVSDPLFCIGGYERLELSKCMDFSTVSSGEEEECNPKKSRVLTGMGSNIAQALSCYCRHVFERNAILGVHDVKIAHAPESIMVSKSMAHDAMGCKTGCRLVKDVSKCSICRTADDENDGFIRAPSYMALSLMQQNKSFTDRALPQVYLCPTQRQNMPDSNDSRSRYAHPMEQMEIFAISTSNLIMSRILCDKIAHAIIDCYASLISTNVNCRGMHMKIMSHNEHEPLRVRMSNPSELEPNEARRLVIEGYSKARQAYIVLGHVSNYTDYISRAYKIKCTGTKLQGQGVEYTHLIHGVICQGSSALNWFLDNNVAIMEKDEQSENTRANRAMMGIGIPPALVPFLSQNMHQSPGTRMWIPFIRDIFKGKGGKVSVKQWDTNVDPVILNTKSPSCDLKISAERDNRINIKSKSIKSTNERQILEQTNRRNLCKDDIIAEASCNPYDFLPFFK